MKDEWTGAAVGKMHVYEITQTELAEELGVTRSYITLILNGKKKPAGARQKVEDALDRLIERQKAK